MKAPYQITRHTIAETPSILGRYVFTLRHVPSDRIITTMRGTCPIAPKRLRAMQAQLNSNELLGSI